MKSKGLHSSAYDEDLQQVCDEMLEVFYGKSREEAILCCASKYGKDIEEVAFDLSSKFFEKLLQSDSITCENYSIQHIFLNSKDSYDTIDASIIEMNFHAIFFGDAELPKKLIDATSILQNFPKIHLPIKTYISLHKGPTHSTYRMFAFDDITEMHFTVTAEICLLNDSLRRLVSTKIKELQNKSCNNENW